MNPSPPAHRWLIPLLRVALVVALALAGWLIYRHLPHDDASAPGSSGAQARETTLHIVLRSSAGEESATTNTTTGATADGAAKSATNLSAPVQLYSIDLAAAQREFFDERRPGQRFEDFIVRRMGARQPVKTELDASGQTTVSLPPGRWWIHATREGAEEVTWRLPVNVAGRELTVELTPANAYTRTKKF